MWMTLVSSLQGVSSAAAEDAAQVAPEEPSDAAVPPGAFPGFDEKLPTPEQFLEMLDTMTGISEEEKASLREELLKTIRDHGYPMDPVAGDDLTVQTIVLLSLLGVVALIFVNGDRNMAENVLDSLRGHGLLSDSLQEKLSELLPEDAREKLSGFFQRYQELSDEEKQEVLSSVLGKVQQSVHEKVHGDSNFFAQFLFTHTYTVFFFAVLLIVLVLVFFIYKLFRCLKEREIKREEKKKNKQLKKKK